MRANSFAMLSMPLLAIAMSACGFPEVETVPAEGPAGPATSTGSGGHGGATASVTAASVTASGSGGSGTTASTASSVTSSAQSSSAQSSSASGSGGGPVDCDFDNDGVDGAQCGGKDCDDDDARTYPNQTNYFSDKPSKTTQKWDFNCDGIESEQYTMAVACDKGGQCPKTNVFIAAAPPACGMTAPYGDCVSDAIVSCKPGTPLGTQIQPCR